MMTGLFQVVLTECQKITKSKIFIISLVSILLITFVCGLFMLIAMDPDVATKSGLITQKARIITVASWQSYLSLLAQAISVGGIIIFGFITSWTFGREYADGTAKDLLALPIPRSTIVASKFISVAIWCVFLAIACFILTTVVGLVISVPDFDPQIFIKGSFIYFASALMVTVLCPPIAYFACFGKGYLSPLGFLVFVLFVGNILATMGHGAYFPWSIPGIYSGAAGSVILPVISYIIVIFTGLVGAILTFAWWRYADQQ